MNQSGLFPKQRKYEKGMPTFAAGIPFTIASIQLLAIRTILFGDSFMRYVFVWESYYFRKKRISVSFFLLYGV